MGGSKALLPDDRWERYREVGGLYDFAKWIFPTHKWVDRIHRPSADIYERDLVHVLTHRGKRGEDERLRINMVLMPRFSLKTTLRIQAFCLWATTIEPNIRIVLGSRREGLAQASLGAIKRIMEGDQRYIDRFGRRKPDSSHYDMRLAWAANGIIVADRTEHWLKERTIEVVGVRNLDPGTHFDIGLWDDPHGDDSPTEIDETWNSLQNYVPISEPWGVIGITMTVWNEWDVPARVQQEWGTILAEPVLHMPACDPEFTETYMPELYSMDQLLQHRQLMGSYKAGCQFALTRMSEDEQKFPASFWREERIDRKLMKLVVLSLDPAYDFIGITAANMRWEKRQNSDHAIVVEGWMGGPNVHFLDAEADQWGEDQFLDKIVEKIKIFKPEYVLIEDNAVRYFVGMGLESRLRKFDARKGERRPQIETCKTHGVAKLERIRVMIDPYKGGQTTFSPDITMKEKFQKQFFQYSTRAKSLKLDMLDAAAQGYEFMRLRMPSDAVPMPTDYIQHLDSLESARPGWYKAMMKGESGRLPFLREGNRSWKSL